MIPVDSIAGKNDQPLQSRTVMEENRKANERASYRTFTIIYWRSANSEDIIIWEHRAGEISSNSTVIDYTKNLLDPVMKKNF